MFEIFKQPNFDFMGKRRFWLGLSALLTIAALVTLGVKGINLGIEFTGGTEVQIKYAEAPDLGGIRSALKSAGLSSNLVTTIGDPKAHEVYIRLGIEPGAEEQDLAPRLVEALRSEEARRLRAEGRFDLNIADEATLRDALDESPDVSRDAAAALAAAIAGLRKEIDVFRSIDEVAALPGMTPEALEQLRAKTFVGPFAVRSQSYIGPAIGKELIRKALLSILGSLAGMLVYIAFRFQFRWGVAAVVALTHDTVMTLGLFSAFGKEMSLPVVAAFLTLVGYSVNDTVVIFDRIRENIKLRGDGDLVTLINLSINQTLSRTILSSGLTALVVVALLLFAGEALNPFAFVLAIGIVVGTYSTFYIASPILIAWESLSGRKGSQTPKSAPAPRKAKKVRSSAG